jgi:hypothetical protein
MVAKSKYRLVNREKATAEDKRRTEIIEQILFNDMEHSFEDFVSKAMTMIEYGFAPIEKVFRYRKRSNGSKYDDGYLGLEKLALRHQESIARFVFDANNQYVIGIVQDRSKLSNPFAVKYNHATPNVSIPIEKILLFTCGDVTGNPYGSSPLRNAYIPWRFLGNIEELEAAGIAKDLQGLPVLHVPMEFMNADASADKKLALTRFQNLVRNIQQNSQGGVLLPTYYDRETKQPMFKLELLSNDGKKNYDTDKTKDYYRVMIFIALSADILLQGNTSVGSFNSGIIKTSLTGNAVESYLKHIVSVVNRDLIPELYKRNGWDVTRTCTLDYEGFEPFDLEVYSKAVQRMAVAGLVPRNLDLVNRNLSVLGIDTLDADTKQEELESMLTESTSRSGDGMATPFEGTRTSQGTGDDNANNLENTA